MNLRGKVEALFGQLADLDPQERIRYFSEHPVDAETRREVEALLAGDETTDRLSILVGRQVESALNERGPAAQATCGPYRMLRMIGRGGMGEVWLAERTDGFLKRPVALKLPYAGAGSAIFGERLTREKDILAGLVHPGIAQLYDAGVAEGGRPFLALEFIEGTNLAAYCDQNTLSVRDRIALFLQVLNAVQYAHSRLVIHRDLKPSNILVTASGEVKLLDFGIAKLMTEGEAFETELTHRGGRALTLPYASPEQISGQTITTASDVFSLGLILFELLAGERAFVPARESPAALEEAILTTEPRRPSQRVAGEEHARARSTTRRKLQAQLKGDLDLIVLKALRKQPDERYPTVDALRADIERYLAGEAVLAQPPSARYRFKKFVWRHKLPVLSAAATFVALAAGLSVALWQASVARNEARTSAAVQAFTEDIFRANSLEQPDPVKARETTARQLLDIGARKVADSLNDAPAAKLRMVTILGSLYHDLGLDDKAVAMNRQRLALAKKMYGPRSPLIVPALIELGSAMHSSRSVNEEDAVLLEAKSILDAKGDYTSPTRGELLTFLAESYSSTDQPKSLAYAKESIGIYRKFPPSAGLMAALYVSGVASSAAGENEQAAVHLREAIALSKKFNGDPNLDLPRYYAFEAQAENELNQYAAAEGDYRAAFRYAQKLNGDQDVDTLETESRLGTFLVSTSRPRLALPFLEKAKDDCLKTKGPDDPFYTPQMLLQYGSALQAVGRPGEALRYISDAVENRRKNRPGTRYLAQMLQNQASVLIELGRYRNARQLLEEAGQIRAKVGQKEDRSYMAPRIKLALAEGNVGEATGLIERFYGPVPDSAPVSIRLLQNMQARAELALLANDGEKAISTAHRLAEVIQSSHQEIYLRTWQSAAELVEGEGRLMEKDPPSALALFQQAIQNQSEMLEPSAPTRIQTQALLGIAYFDLGDRAKARDVLTQARAMLQKHPELSDRYLRPVHVLAARLAGSGRPVPATKEN